jgi:hypothetical protein
MASRSLDIVGLRLRHQRLAGPRLATPGDVVRWLGAVQAQEYDNAMWALALRTRCSSAVGIERAIASGTIVRTHVMRPTWHFVAAEDIRWMLALTAPRVSARMAPYNRHLELDAAVFRRSERVIVRALHGGAQLTRQELKVVLQRAGVRTDSVQRLAHLLIRAEIDSVICSGARRHNQFTYALMDERVPSTRTLSPDDALAELTRRYFQSHGPAQIGDFVWWSGLTVRDARRGLEMLGRGVEHEEVAGKAYWFIGTATARGYSSVTYLLGLYDEYLIGYKDRSAALDRSRWNEAITDPFSAPIVVDGKVAGGWRKSAKGDLMVITLTPLRSFTRNEGAALNEAARAYGDFLRVDVTTRVMPAATSRNP